MSKRDITPHKGGRTVMTSVRLSPEEKKALFDELERLNMSLADWIVSKLAEVQPDD